MTWIKARFGMQPTSFIAGAALSPEDQELQNIKTEMHYKVVEKIDLATLHAMPKGQAELELESAIGSLIDTDLTERHLSPMQRNSLTKGIRDEVMGLGPLEPLLADDSITEIMCNGYNQVYIERDGLIEKTRTRFRDDDHLRYLIEKIASAVDRRIDEMSPMVDARLKDGSRVNAVIPPLSLKGPTLNIRKFSRVPLTATDLINFGSLSPEVVVLLEAVVAARLNVIISGGTGTGKTTMLNILSSYIPPSERIVTIEDSAELQLTQEHVVSLESRPPNIEGQGKVAIRDLVINSLRMRPDRIIVGECRGGEALDMVQAMNTGHDGSLTTVHSNSPRDALIRLETMVSMAGLEITEKAIRRALSSAIDLIIQLARMEDGSRKVISVTELTGMEEDVVTMQEIFRFNRQGVDELGQVIGQFGSTGIRPKFSEKLLAFGINLNNQLFNMEVRA